MKTAPLNCLLVLIPILLLGQVASANTSALKDSGYLNSLIQKAGETGLADKRYWHVLLHYHQDLFGGHTSEVDDPGFFLAPNGKTDPEAELIATLKAFFSDTVIGESRQPAQCAFIARYHWLRDTLSFDHERISPPQCDEFAQWFHELNAESITLVFPSAFMNNPASMFGHTLLRIDQKGQTDQARLLAYTLNYAADVTTENGFAFAFMGMTGGFKGYYSTHPYYMKVNEYRDIENRDIWEYRLNLSDEQLTRMLEHAWEIGHSYFDYYFFKENCAYNILSLLEVARPDLRLTDQFSFWTIPADTIRLVTDQPGLVGDITFRPARGTKIRQKYDVLSADEANVLHGLIENPTSVIPEELTPYSAERQAFLLDVASDYLQFQRINGDGDPSVLRAKVHEVLTTRSSLDVTSEPFAVVPFAGQPERGHKTARVGVGIGWRDDEIFEEVTIRAAYHDLLDPNPGFTRDTQIELLTASFRHYETSNKFRLEELTLVDVVSLSPIDALFAAPSWKMSAGLDTVIRDGCRLCRNTNVNGGIGVATESAWIKREVAFALAEVDANYSHAFEENHRVGAGGTIGVLADITNRWKMLVTGTYLQYPFGEKSHDLRSSIQQRVTIGQNWSVRFELNDRDEDTEGRFLLHAYF